LRNSRKTAAAVAAVLSFGLVAAACGSSSKTSSNTTTTAGGAATTAAGGASTTAGATTTAASATPAGGTVSESVEQEFSSLNANTSADISTANAYILAQVTPGPFFFNAKGDLEMDTNFVDKADLTSQDPQVVTYVVNKNAVWSDGTPIGCDDFYLQWIANNGKVTKKAADGTDVSIFDTAGTTGYENISKLDCSADGKTITTTYDTKFGDWKGLFTGLIPADITVKGAGLTAATMRTAYDASIAAKAATPELTKLADFWSNGYKADPALKPEVNFSGGPYIIKDFKKGESLTEVRNDKYWGPPAQLDTVVFRLIGDATAEPQALQNDEVQVINPQPNPDLLQQLNGLSGVKVTQAGGFTFEHFDFNFKNPLLADIAVRQAFALCLPRQEIVDKLIKPLNENAVVMDNRFTYPFQDAYKAQAGDYAKQDIAKAKSTLEAAGYTLGTDGIYQKGGQKLNFKIVRKDPNPRRQQEVQLTADACKQAGIGITDDPDADIFTKRLPAGDYDIALFAWQGSSLQSPNKSIYVTDGGQNYGKWTNKDMDAVLNQLTTELDPAKVFDLANQADAIAWKDLATIPVFQFPDLVANSDKVQNVIYNPTQQTINWNLQKWTAK